MSKITVVCAECGIKFPRRCGEHNRSIRLERNEFCCQSHATSYRNKHSEAVKASSRKRLAEHNLNQIDHYSPFRWYLNCIRRRVAAKRWNKGPHNLTLEYLLDLWEIQKGTCPYTGWSLELPRGSQGWHNKQPPPQYKASLDRIDSSIGYVQGNVQFVSMIANFAKSQYPDSVMIEFCKAVAGHCSD